MARGHDHSHEHHPAAGNRRALSMVLGIDAAILVAEVAGALVSGSLALLADAGHMLTDVAGLTLAVVAATLAARPATPQRTWGFRRAEVLAAAAQAAVLLAVGGFVLVEAVMRLVTPPNVSAGVMLIFGAVGVVGNGFSVVLLSRLVGGNLNTRAARLEVLNDMLGAAAVLIAAAVIALTGWLRADAAASLLIGALIIPRTWKLLRETIDVLLESTPRGTDLGEVRRHMLEIEGVETVHDLHASAVVTDLPVLTAHVVVRDECFSDGSLPGLLERLRECCVGCFDIEHSTFQFEPAGHQAQERADCV